MNTNLKIFYRVQNLGVRFSAIDISSLSNPNHEEIHVTWAFTGNTKCGDGVADFKRRRRDFQSDGVMDLTTALGRSRIKVALEDTTWRQSDRNLRELSGEEAWEAIENFAQGQKE
ncbi:hypothetical protein Tco_0945111 [Tanacetum coccineum]